MKANHLRQVIEESKEAVRQVYTTDSGFITPLPKALPIISEDWLAREITKKEF